MNTSHPPDLSLGRFTISGYTPVSNFDETQSVQAQRSVVGYFSGAEQFFIPVNRIRIPILTPGQDEQPLFQLLNELGQTRNALVVGNHPQLKARSFAELKQLTALKRLGKLSTPQQTELFFEGANLPNKIKATLKKFIRS